MTKNIVFGPIASRRLGRSLGIDLLMEKICCQDCIYCEAGKTKIHTLERKSYVPFADVIGQLNAVLAKEPETDYITFSGSGEPTLSADIGRVIGFLKDTCPRYRVCVLTNGMLLGDPDVRRDVARADLVIPSLDASCQEEFDRINRPVPGSGFVPFTRGLAGFTRQFRGQVWLEIFIIPGVNDSDASIGRFARLAGTMRLDRIQLNSLDRPGTGNVAVSTEENAQRFVDVLSEIAPTEFIRRFRSSDAPPETAESRLLKLLRKGPLHREEVGKRLDLSDYEAGLLVRRLQFSGDLHLAGKDGAVFVCSGRGPEK
ncbi:MAG: radical SAM protein [Lentisphaeria bacterium]|nr:radical SAM protein [Lentisphaeria bacterium]